MISRVPIVGLVAGLLPLTDADADADAVADADADAPSVCQAETCTSCAPVRCSTVCHRVADKRPCSTNVAVETGIKNSTTGMCLAGSSRSDADAMVAKRRNSAHTEAGSLFPSLSLSLSLDGGRCCCGCGAIGNSWGGSGLAALTAAVDGEADEDDDGGGDRRSATASSAGKNRRRREPFTINDDDDDGDEADDADEAIASGEEASCGMDPIDG